MEVTLKVTSGSNAGQQIPVPGPKFLIGRAEDCQLRPRSDLISRYHCVIMSEDGLVTVRDFGSKNFTYVNDERLIGECELKPGDLLKVGPLEFELCIKATVGAGKRPKVESVQAVVERTVESATAGEFDLNQFLDDGAAAQSSADTRKIVMQDTEHSMPAPNGGASDESVSNADAQTMAGKGQPAKRATVDSRAAADKALRQFFKRR
ncbi:MAG: FHA domain-containing protein [Planctomycetia bacterium]|nr:FHA domain-containing protein [Planctomycetia bacterium]